jgi:hypothetical protein
VHPAVVVPAGEVAAANPAEAVLAMAPAESAVRVSVPAAEARWHRGR